MEGLQKCTPLEDHRIVREDSSCKGDMACTAGSCMEYARTAENLYSSQGNTQYQTSVAPSNQVAQSECEGESPNSARFLRSVKHLVVHVLVVDCAGSAAALSGDDWAKCPAGDDLGKEETLAQRESAILSLQESRLHLEQVHQSAILSDRSTRCFSGRCALGLTLLVPVGHLWFSHSAQGKRLLSLLLLLPSSHQRGRLSDSMKRRCWT